MRSRRRRSCGIFWRGCLRECDPNRAAAGLKTLARKAEREARGEDQGFAVGGFTIGTPEGLLAGLAAGLSAGLSVGFAGVSRGF